MDISIDENTKDLILDIANSYKEIKKISSILAVGVAFLL